MPTSAPVIASAASIVAPPANTAKRAKPACASSSSSSWLQSIVALQRLLARAASRAPAPERAERVVEALGDLDRRQQSAPGGRELDRQRQAVDAPADLPDRGGVAVVEREAGIVGSRAVAEQRDRVHAGQRVATRDAPTCGQRQWRHRQALLGAAGRAARGSWRGP